MKHTPLIVSEYRSLALRTRSAALFLNKDDKKYCTSDQLHAVIGLVTEIQEISTDASKQEEISDTAWFCNLAADSIDVNFASMLHEATQDVRRNLLATSGLARDVQMQKLNKAAIHLLDCAKASIYYGREMHKNLLHKGEKLSWHDTIMNDIKAVAEAIAYLCVIWKIDIYETLEKNIAKLALRYPEEFDTHKASNRNTEKELGVFLNASGSFEGNSPEEKNDMESISTGTPINVKPYETGTLTSDSDCAYKADSEQANDISPQESTENLSVTKESSDEEILSASSGHSEVEDNLNAKENSHKQAKNSSKKKRGQ